MSLTGCKFVWKFCIAIFCSFIMRLRLVLWFYIVKTAIQAEICVENVKNVEHFAPRYSQIRILVTYQVSLRRKQHHYTPVRLVKLVRNCWLWMRWCLVCTSYVNVAPLLLRAHFVLTPTPSIELGYAQLQATIFSLCTSYNSGPRFRPISRESHLILAR